MSCFRLIASASHTDLSSFRLLNVYICNYPHFLVNIFSIQNFEVCYDIFFQPVLIWLDSLSISPFYILLLLQLWLPFFSSNPPFSLQALQPAACSGRSSPPPPGSSGHSWAPAPPGPGELPSPRSWPNRSRSAACRAPPAPARCHRGMRPGAEGGREQQNLYSQCLHNGCNDLSTKSLCTANQLLSSTELFIPLLQSPGSNSIVLQRAGLDFLFCGV